MPSPLHPRAVRTRFVALAAAAFVAGGIDVLFSFAWWAPRGAPPTAVLHAIGTWVLGPAAPWTWATAASGLLLQWLLYLAFACFFAAVMRWRGARAHWIVAGVSGGLVAYLLLFGFIVPWIAAPVVPAHDGNWTRACAVVHLALIGPMLAWLLAVFPASRRSLRAAAEGPPGFLACD